MALQMFAFSILRACLGSSSDGYERAGTADRNARLAGASGCQLAAKSVRFEADRWDGVGSFCQLCTRLVG